MGKKRRKAVSPSLASTSNFPPIRLIRRTVMWSPLPLLHEHLHVSHLVKPPAHSAGHAPVKGVQEVLRPVDGGLAGKSADAPSRLSGMGGELHLNCVFKPRKICHFGHPAPLSAIDTCGSMKMLKTTFSRGITWPMPSPIGTL
jgi:hypothetical protein